MTSDVHATVTVEQTYPYEADEAQRNNDFALSEWFSGAMLTYLSNEGGKGDIIKLKTETSRGKIKLAGIVSNEALRRRVVEKADVLKAVSGRITSLDSSGVKAPESTAGEPAPQRIPLTDGEIVDRVESLVEWPLVASSLPGEEIELVVTCTNGVVSISGSTNSPMLYRRLGELAAQVKDGTPEIKRIDHSGVKL